MSEVARFSYRSLVRAGRLPASILRGRDPGVCHHEAGHVLVNLYVGFPFEKVTVNTRLQCDQRRLRRADGNDAAGTVTGTRHDLYMLMDGLARARTLFGDQGARHVRDNAERYLIGLRAGAIAENLCDEGFSGPEGEEPDLDYYLDEDSRDYLDSEKIIALLTDSPTRRQLFWTRAADQSEALVCSPHGWSFITELALRLERRGTILEAEARSVFRQVWGRPSPDLHHWNGHWPPTLAQIQAGWLPPGEDAGQALAA
jgi:hypothetical protein